MRNSKIARDHNEHMMPTWGWSLQVGTTTRQNATSAQNPFSSIETHTAQLTNRFFFRYKSEEKKIPENKNKVKLLPDDATCERQSKFTTSTKNVAGTHVQQEQQHPTPSQKYLDGGSKTPHLLASPSPPPHPPYQKQPPMFARTRTTRVKQ